MNHEARVDQAQMRAAAAKLGRKANWMQTASGGLFFPTDPTPEEVKIEDIAHALSLLCRFGGHCRRFYSVAEHCYHVSTVVPFEYALEGLLHDATEAYVCDIPRPLKVELRDYAHIEERVAEAIARKFNLKPFPPCIKAADNAVLLAEKAALLPAISHDWCVPGEPANVGILCMDPLVAKAMFLHRFNQLTLKWPGLEIAA